MRDYIVTHATKGLASFVPRVVRANDATEALRATVIDLSWQDRTIRRSRYKDQMVDPQNYGRWYCDSGAYGRDALDVMPFYPSNWDWVLNRHDRDIVRINRRGEYVRWLGVTRRAVS